MSDTALPHPIDPELATDLAALPRGANGKLLDLSDIPGQRAQMAIAAETMAAQFPTDPAVSVDVHTVARPGTGGGLELIIYRPTAATQPLPAVVYFHPGGQVFGQGLRQDGPMGSTALALDCALVAVDYRCAPETQAPGGAEDGLLAWTHVVAHATDLGIDAGRIGIAAASGGGAPAAATALMIRDRGLAAPRLLALSYPMLDDRNVSRSSREILDIGIWDRQENELAWQAVLGDRYGGDEIDPYSAPARATDLRGLPRSFIAVGQFDVFRDESIAFATRLIAAGVPTDLHVYGSAYHSFDLMAPAAALSREFTATWQAFMRRELHPA